MRAYIINHCALTSKQLIQVLRLVHANSSTMIVIFDQMCQFLAKNTTEKDGAYTAVQEWAVFDALKVYLPAPLSGMMFEPYSQQNMEYKIGLMDLPASFFDLCCNLCLVDSGAAHCLSLGFLRRALDKLTLLSNKHGYSTNDDNYLVATDANRNSMLLPQLTRHSPHRSMTSKRDQFDSFWSHGMREEPQEREISRHKMQTVVACLRLVARMANFSSHRDGTANELILWHFFSVVETCRFFITEQIYARDDPVYLTSLELLAALARDTYRMHHVIEQFDVLRVVRNELNQCERLRTDSVEKALEIVHYSVNGITSE